MLLLLGSLNHRAISVVPDGMQVLWHTGSETQCFLSAARCQGGEPALSECAPAIRFAWSLLLLAGYWPFLWPPRSPLGSITSSFSDRCSHRESIVHFLENYKVIKYSFFSPCVFCTLTTARYQSVMCSSSPACLGASGVHLAR